MWFEDFPDGCHGVHLGYWNATILAILNLHVGPMLLTMSAQSDMILEMLKM